MGRCGTQFTDGTTCGDSAKRDHVRARKRAGVTHGHHCHWPGCPKLCTPAQWGCYPHWMRLPKYLRDKIWRAYRIGQEDTKTPSREYVAVAREVQLWISIELSGL